MNTSKAWYIRSSADGAIKGPFPAGQISQEVLLGRYKIDDEVSHDKEDWVKVRSVRELLPEIFLQDRKDPAFNDRLAAARRWADERRGIANIDSSEDRRENESYDSEELKRLHRLSNKTKEQTKPLTTFLQLAFVFVIILALIILAFQYSPKQSDTADCSAEAGQEVNWSNCNLTGAKLAEAQLIAANLMGTNLQTANLYNANLSHANLQYSQLHLSNLKYTNLAKANLKGASLMGADLSNASFIQADLSYVNFRDAIISNTDFSQARLDNAIWIDGRTCSTNSIGSCN